MRQTIACRRRLRQEPRKRRHQEQHRNHHAPHPPKVLPRQVQCTLPLIVAHKHHRQANEPQQGVPHYNRERRSQEAILLQNQNTRRQDGHARPTRQLNRRELPSRLLRIDQQMLPLHLHNFLIAQMVSSTKMTHR